MAAAESVIPGFVCDFCFGLASGSGPGLLRVDHSGSLAVSARRNQAGRLRGMDDRPGERLIDRGVRNRVMEALEPLAEGDDGVHAVGTVDDINVFVDVIGRSPRTAPDAGSWSIQ